MNLLKSMLLGLLFCWLLAMPYTCSAQSYTMTEQQYQQWKRDSERQTQITNALLLGTASSNELIINLQENLQTQINSVASLKASLQKASDLQEQSAKLIEQQRLDLTNQQQLINEQRSLLAKLEKQANKRWGIGAYVGTESAGIIVKKDAVFVMGGPKNNGGYEVSAGVMGRF